MTPPLLGTLRCLQELPELPKAVLTELGLPTSSGLGAPDTASASDSAFPLFHKLNG